MKCIVGIIALNILNMSILNAKVTWQSGNILTNDQHVFHGEIYFNPNEDYLQFKEGKSIKTFSPYQVVSFSFYDSLFSFTRNFVSSKYYQKHRNKKSFFELITAGEVSLLRKEIFRKKSIVNDMSGKAFIKYNFKFSYFTLYKNQIETLDDFFEELSKYQKQDLPELISFLKINDCIKKNLKFKLEMISKYNAYTENKSQESCIIVYLKDTIYKPL